MKDEPWRGDPALRVQHLEQKLSNKKTRIRELEAALAEMQGVVERLPKDRNGNPVALGDTLYLVDETNGHLYEGVASIGFSSGSVSAFFKSKLGDNQEKTWVVEVSLCSITKEAALAAREGE